MGFSDHELGYAYALPPGVANPNTGPPLYGGDLVLDPPGVCVTEG